MTEEEMDTKVLDLMKQGILHSIGITCSILQSTVTHAHDFFPMQNKVLASLVRLHKTKKIDARGPELVILEDQ